MAAIDVQQADRYTVQIRVTREEHAAFLAAAERVGLPPGAWLRQIARKAVGLPAMEQPEPDAG